MTDDRWRGGDARRANGRDRDRDRDRGNANGSDSGLSHSHDHSDNGERGRGDDRDHGHGVDADHRRGVSHDHDRSDNGERGRGRIHDHDRHDHDHGAAVSADSDVRLLTAALGLILAFMAAEVVLGFTAHSLALLSDAGHMLTDAAALGLALFAMRLAARPASGPWTYGLRRAEILSAQANGITLLVLVVIFIIEAVRRLIEPPAVVGGLVTGTAVAGIAINALAAWLISRANRTSLNVEGAFQHILSDAWAFLATAAAGVVILTTGFARADAIASLFVAALMARAGYGLVSASWRIFLEGAPPGLDPAAIGAELVADPQVDEVHDLHVWTITSGFAALSAHVLVRPGEDCHAVRGRLQDLLREKYGIQHATLQVDHAPEPLLSIERSRPERPHS